VFSLLAGDKVRLLNALFLRALPSIKKGLRFLLEKQLNQSIGMRQKGG